MKDNFNRTINYMRLSITDRCNFRCQYCMPKDTTYDTDISDILTINDIELITSKLNVIGIGKIKLTGGEPLMRQDIADIVNVLKNNCGIKEVTLTTNGVLLDQYIHDLEMAGLDAITISIDSINEDDFNTITRRNDYSRVINNIKLAKCSTISNIKLNVVPLRKYGEQNIIDLIEFANENDVHIRFIEMMPIGLGRQYKGYSYQEVISIIENRFGAINQSTEQLGNGPASYFTSSNLDIKVGVISALSNKFCENCNRIRVTSNGHLKQCLHYNRNIDLKEILKTDDGLKQIESFIKAKPEEHSFLKKSDLTLESKKMSDIGG